MKKTKYKYPEELAIAKRNLADLHERGEDAIGGDVLEFIESFLTQAEIAASNLRVAIMCELIEARNERGISKEKLAELSGIKKSVITRIERGGTSFKIDTVLKVLVPLGKTLAVVPLVE